jgi:F subunit of K+-transporting ATPase
MIAALSDYDNWIGLVLAVLGVIFLIIVLVFPERF